MAAHTPPQKLPDGIEVFRAGRHTDDAGQVHEFSEADVADMSSGYSTALREAPRPMPAPVSQPREMPRSEPRQAPAGDGHRGGPQGRNDRPDGHGPR